MSKEHLGELEELVLLVIITLKEEAYGLAIRNAIVKQTGRKITIGAIHGTVNRLEDKGYIESSLGGASEVRGGRRKRLFHITNHGKQALQKSQDLKVKLWGQIPYLDLGFSKI